MVFLFPGLSLWGCARNLAEARPAAQKQTRPPGGAIKRTGFSVKGQHRQQEYSTQKASGGAEIVLPHLATATESP